MNLDHWVETDRLFRTDGISYQTPHPLQQSSSRQKAELSCLVRKQGFHWLQQEKDICMGEGRGKGCEWSLKDKLTSYLMSNNSHVFKTMGFWVELKKEFELIYQNVYHYTILKLDWKHFGIPYYIKMHIWDSYHNHTILKWKSGSIP